MEINDSERRRGKREALLQRWKSKRRNVCRLPYRFLKYISNLRFANGVLSQSPRFLFAYHIQLKKIITFVKTIFLTFTSGRKILFIH